MFQIIDFTFGCDPLDTMYITYEDATPDFEKLKSEYPGHKFSIECVPDVDELQLDTED